jgi:hypothetical protein
MCIETSLMYDDVTYINWCISYIRCAIYVCECVAYVLKCSAFCRFNTYICTGLPLTFRTYLPFEECKVRTPAKVSKDQSYLLL